VSHHLAVVARLCETVAVMDRGRFVETVAVPALRRGEVRHPYTARLLAASGGYRRPSAGGPD
jgi:peptide/nickel transport system ATP-binding protein